MCRPLQCEVSGPRAHSLWGGRKPAASPRERLRALGFGEKGWSGAMPDRLGVMIPLAPVHYKSCRRLDKHMLPSTPFLLWLRRGDVEHDPGPSLRCTQSHRDGLNDTRRCRSALFLDIAMVQHRQTNCGCVWAKLLTGSWQKGHFEENTKKGSLSSSFAS